MANPRGCRQVRPGLAGSFEALFHDVELERFLLLLRGNEELSVALKSSRLQRAIGVLYLPDTERVSHYFNVRLPKQFDAMIHFDGTCAVTPLERGAAWVVDEVPETYPSGI